MIDLKLTLIDSAQAFNWTEDGGAFYGVVNGRGYRVTQDDCPLPGGYLGLDRDPAGLLCEYGHIPEARAALTKLPGLRVMRQDAWETVISFILSANNNVSRIRKLTGALCRAYGDPVSAEGRTLYAFPAPEVLAGAREADLRSLGVGYRAPYLIETAAAVAGGFDLEGLKRLPYGEAHKELLTLKGVGDKVADCILLFGLGFEEAFPVDVWVARLMDEWFGIRGTPQKVAAQAREKFGAHGGLLQQYLFHAERTGLLDEK